METVNLSGFDIRHRSQEGADMPLLDPTGRPTRVVFRVRGTDSTEYNDLLKAQVRRWVERAPRKATEDERNAEFWELGAALVAGWFVKKEGGELEPAALQFSADAPPIAYTPENAARLLETHSWVFEQVRRFADTRANFLPGHVSS
jgi:hypothetical protein